MKIFIREIERTSNKTLEEVKREAYDENSPDVVEIVGKDGHSYNELLTKPWAEVQNTGRYKNKKAKALQKPMCSIAYEEKMKILTEADYKKLFGSQGLIIQHSTSKVDPVVDSNGNVHYLKAYGAQISFEAPNDRCKYCDTEVVCNLPICDLLIQFSLFVLSLSLPVIYIAHQTPVSQKEGNGQNSYLR
jgi:hypothetical protein